MHVIKRYANRKLYDTETKQYITLDEVADLVREGRELQVVDNTSGEDLTALTLSQIILEQEKKQKGFLPRSVLNALVEAGGKSVGTLRQRLESPLELLKQVDQEIEQRIQDLIQRGELAEEHGRKLRDQLLERRPIKDSASTLNDEKIEKILEDQEVPTREDLQNLADQIEILSQKITELSS
ncbi:MAG TPA: pesticidal protein Cry15Aa [Chloroflexi bacterium]|nr:pesticidal protein Cry15Aa [Chloroflexota bacterium]HBY07620.1 pesticidal protein Cry15Aa [Chloroflexota bacterium]